MQEKTQEKASPYLGMALLPFVFLGLELLVLIIESLFYGTMDFMQIIEMRGISAALMHWGITCLLWAAGAWLLYVLAHKKGFDVFDNKNRASAMNWGIVAVILVLSLIASYMAWDMRFKPAAELTGMTARFGSQAIWAFIGQYFYYLVESVLFLAIVVFGQKFGELAFRKDKLPWGGILCGLTWGLGHIFTQDLFTGLYSAAISIAFGIVYLLLKKNVRYTYPVIALMFML